MHDDTGTGSDKAGESEDDAKELECDAGGMQSEPKSGLKLNILEALLRYSYLYQPIFKISKEDFLNILTAQLNLES